MRLLLTRSGGWSRRLGGPLQRHLRSADTPRVSRVKYVQMFALGDGSHVAAFQASGVAVCEAFAEGLREQQLDNRHSELRLFAQAADSGEHVLVEVFDDREGFERAEVHIPTAVGDLTHHARALLVLDTLTTAASRLGVLRGWPSAAVAAAREHALDRGLSYAWAGAWKKNRSRVLEARAAYRITGEGAGRASLQLRRVGDDHLTTWSPQATAWQSWEGFKRSAATLRWAGDGLVQVMPYAAPFGVYESILELRPSDEPAGAADLIDPDDRRRAPDELRPRVDLRVNDDTTREIMATGGGPTNYVPQAYWRTLHELFSQLGGAEWHEWWAEADLPTLEISWSAAVQENRLCVRRSKHKLIARIERTGASLRDGDAAHAALTDLAELMTVVQRRLGLGTPPALQHPHS